MVLKIYLGVSILTFVLFCLYNISLIHNAKIKYEEKLKEKENVKVKKDVAGNILSCLKMIVMCFIPIYNLFMIFILLFWNEKMKSASDKMLKDAFEKDENIS